MAASWQTFQNVMDDVRYRTGTGTDSTHTSVVDDTTLIRLGNKYFYQMVAALSEGNEDFHTEIGTFDLTDGKFEYDLPVDDTTGTGSDPYGGGAMGWAVLRLELNLDNSGWRVAQPIDWQSINIGTASATDISAQFSVNSPRYTTYDNSNFIFPIPSQTVSSGGRLFYIKTPQEITSSSAILTAKQFMLSKEWLHVLSYGMSADIFERFGQLSQQQGALVLFEQGLERMKNQSSRRQEDRDLSLKPRFIDYR